MTDVTALGELVIDFSPGGFSQEGHSLYERQPGGAPSNVLAEVVKLGGSAALMGMLGNDEFGEYLLKKVKESGLEQKESSSQIKHTRHWPLYIWRKVGSVASQL